MSSDKYAKYAERVRLFKGLSTRDVEDVLHAGKIIHFHEGQTVFHEGMLGKNMFIVLSGKVALYKKNRIIAYCKVGDAFGEMAVLNRRPRSATASAAEDVKLFTIDERELKQVIRRPLGEKLLLNIIEVLSNHLENANARASELADRIEMAGSPR
jgi:CRP-like cAMP-binding protein